MAPLRIFIVVGEPTGELERTHGLGTGILAGSLA
jgi:hypothetical protein